MNRVFVLCLFMTVLTSMSYAQAKKAEQLYVDNTSVQIKDFLGVNAVYHGFAFMPEQVDRGMNDQDREREFDRIRRMGLNVARTWYRPDFACGNNIYNDFDWNREKMQAFCKWLEVMKKLNVDVAIQAGWWFTYDTHMGNPSCDVETDPKRFAEWVDQSLQYLINERGFDNIKYVHMLTEPMNWDGDGAKPGNYTQPEYYKIVCETTHNELVKSGMRSKVQIVGPNFGSTDNAGYVQWSLDNLSEVFDIISWHTYNGIRDSYPAAEYDGWMQTTEVGAKMVRPTGKQYWIDEYGSTYESLRSSPDYGNYLAQAVAAFTNAGVQNSMIWILFDQQYPNPRNKTNNGDSFVEGVHRWGVAKWPHDSIENPTHPHPSWYSFSMMSRYLGGRNGSVVYHSEGAEKMYVVCSKDGNGDVNVMVVNANHEPKPFTLNFKESVGKRDFYRHSFDPNNLTVDEAALVPPVDKVVKKVSTKISDVIPSRGVVIYTTNKN